MGKAKEVHWHGLRSFRVVIRRVPESSPHNLLPLDTQRHFALLSRCIPLFQDASIGCVRLPPPLSPLPFIDAENQKSLGLSSSSSRGVCVCAIIESHRNRITHGCRDGRETMVVSFANRCQGGFLCSFLVSFSGNCN